MPEPVAVFADVVKEYPTDVLGRRRLRALDHVNLEIGSGEIFGLIGPNRAGKTTLVKLLLSLCRPTGGSVLRLGKPSADKGTLRRIGYVHENPAFPRHFHARGLLEFYGALSLLPEQVVKERSTQLLERVGLADRCYEPIGQFSKGMLQRLALAQALLVDPQLLILDEPSEGLDLAGRLLLREILLERRQLGHSVLYVSHVLSEIEQVCDRIAVLVKGRRSYQGTVAALITKTPTGEVRTLESSLRSFYEPGAVGAPV